MLVAVIICRTHGAFSINEKNSHDCYSDTGFMIGDTVQFTDEAMQTIWFNERENEKGIIQSIDGNLVCWNNRCSHFRWLQKAKQ